MLKTLSRKTVIQYASNILTLLQARQGRVAARTRRKTNHNNKTKRHKNNNNQTNKKTKNNKNNNTKNS